MNIDTVKRLLETQLVEEVCDTVEEDIKSIDPSYVEGNFTDDPYELLLVCVTDIEVIDFREEKSPYHTTVVKGEIEVITDAGAWNKDYKSCGSTVIPLVYTFQFGWDGEHATDLIMENVG